MAWILRTSLMFMLMKYIYSVGPNAQLAATKRGSQVELTCMYVGNGNVSAVRWFNGSNPNPLLLMRNDSDGQFSVFAGSTSPFDMDQVNSSCSHDNICTLVFNGSIDVKSTISCTFLDPDPGEPKATLNLNVTSAPVTTVTSAPVTTVTSAPVMTVTSAPVTTVTSAPITTVTSAPVTTVTSAPVTTGVPGGQTLNTAAIVGIVVGVLVALILIAICACRYCKKKTGNKDPNDINSMEPLQTNRQVSEEEQMTDKIQDVQTDGVAKRGLKLI